MKMPEGEGVNVPTLLFCTISGVIGVIATLTAEQFIFCEKLSQSLSKIIHGIGGFSHAEYVIKREPL